jgi:branched-chain amino acid transport system substrate-binding protein
VLTVSGRKLRIGGGALVAGALVLSMAACSGSGGSGGSGKGLPSTVTLVSIKDRTGVPAFAGTSTNKGIQVAVDEINGSGYLGSTKIAVDYKDPAGVAQTAASLTTAAISNKKYAAILGPITSDEATAVAPIVQKSKMPTVFTQAGSEGVVVGDYTFRATAPQATYYATTLKYLQGKGVKKIGILYGANNPTNAQLAEKVIPGLTAQYGLTVASTATVQASTQDFSAPANKAIAAGAEAVVVLLVGPQYPTAVQAIRQAGFRGTIAAAVAAGAGTLGPAGQDGVGVIWATDFTAAADAPAATKFVKLYQTKFPGELPLNYAAEGYDSTWMVARALKAANGAGRSAIQSGLTTVAKAGFTGAEGDLTFEGNDMRVPGIAVKWTGTREALLAPTS